MLSDKKKVLLLGSTGSIGRQTLEVIERHPDKFEVVGLAAGSNAKMLFEQVRKFDVKHASLACLPDQVPDASQADGIAGLKSALKGEATWLAFGDQAAYDLIDNVDFDIAVNSLVGFAGLKASYNVLLLGKRLALANKESLVAGGDILMPMAHELDGPLPTDALGHTIFRPEGHLVPIDSEHGAIFQCLLGEDIDEVSKLWVTASGGPFRELDTSSMRSLTAKDALAHPTWNMGPKITIDSSTLMNKGLEVIEAHHLFDMPYDKIDVVIHPQSIVHSMVEFTDASVKAHLGTTDMRIPIQFSLSYPERYDSPVSPLDFKTLGTLSFLGPDRDRFRCLHLAEEAGREGGILPCAMNAANEVAVAAFLAGSCGFLDIPACVEHVMELTPNEEVISIDQLIGVDDSSRRSAEAFLSQHD